MIFLLFFFKQKTAYEMRISDWSSDVCSSDLKLACHLCLAPEIPARQAVLFSHRINAVDRPIPAPKKLSERIIDNVEPRAVLTLGSELNLRHWKSAPEHRAALTFIYDGHVADDKEVTQVSVQIGRANV